jgi:hypothetical protein
MQSAIWSIGLRRPLNPDTVSMLEQTLGHFTLPELRRLLCPQLAGSARAEPRRLPQDSPVCRSVHRTARSHNEHQRCATSRARRRTQSELSVVHWSAIALWARDQRVDLDEATRLVDECGGAGLISLVELTKSFIFARGPLFGPNGQTELESLKSYERDPVLARVGAWLAEHQDEAEAIRQMVTAGSIDPPA